MRALECGDVIEGGARAYRIIGEALVGGQALGYPADDAERAWPRDHPGPHPRGPNCAGSHCAAPGYYLKVFKSPTAMLPEARDFATRQRMLLERLPRVHDYVVLEHEFFETGGIFYKSAQWIDAEDLRKLLERAETSPSVLDRRTRNVNACVIAYALKKVHAQGIAHLDLSDANIFLEHPAGAPNPVARLIDFDGASVEGGPPLHRVLGTPQYSSPEHEIPARGDPAQDSDVFSLSVILYQLLCQQYPYVDLKLETKDRRLARHPAKVAPWLRPDVAEVIWLGMSGDRRERPTAESIHATLIRQPEPVRICLVADGLKFSFHRRENIIGRGDFRGLAGYEYWEAQQLKLERDDSDWYVTVLPGTKNRSTLNDEPLVVGERMLLGDGDRLRTGRGTLELTVHVERQ